MLLQALLAIMCPECRVTTNKPNTFTFGITKQPRVYFTFQYCLRVTMEYLNCAILQLQVSIQVSNVLTRVEHHQYGTKDKKQLRYCGYERP